MSMTGKPIFIVGNSRSGTTMLGRILGNHSKVHTFGELHFFEHLIGPQEVVSRKEMKEDQCLSLLERLLTTSRDGFFAEVKSGKFQNDAKRILAEVTRQDPLSVYQAFLFLETQAHGKVVPCEQTPRYLYYVREILDAFPDAKVINMIRDPRSVMLSQKNKWKRRFLGAKNIPLKEALRSWSNYHPYTIARLWKSAIIEARKYESHPRFYSIRYEDLVSRPSEIVRKLCDFTGLGFEDQMLNIPKVGSSLGKDDPGSLGIDPARALSWRTGGLTDTEIAICERVCKNAMNMYHYDPVSNNRMTMRYALTMSVFPLKATLALLMNIHRTKDLRVTLQRRLGMGK